MTTTIHEQRAPSSTICISVAHLLQIFFFFVVTAVFYALVKMAFSGSNPKSSFVEMRASLTPTTIQLEEKTSFDMRCTQPFQQELQTQWPLFLKRIQVGISIFILWQILTFKNISTEMILNNSGFCHHKIHRSKNRKRSKTDFTKHHLTFFVAFTLYSHSQIIGYLTLARVWFWSKNLPSSSICCFIVQWRSIGGKKKNVLASAKDKCVPLVIWHLCKWFVNMECTAMLHPLKMAKQLCS